MKYFLTTVITGVVSLLLVSAPAYAEPVGSITDPLPVPKANHLVVTAYRAVPNNLVFVQLHNASDEAITVQGWEVVLVAKSNATDPGVEIGLAVLEDWIAPRGHVVLSLDDAITGADIIYSFDSDIYDELALRPSKMLHVIPPDDANTAPLNQILTNHTALWHQRNLSTTGSGAYLTTFGTRDFPAALLGGGSYWPVNGVAGLRIVEILANARNCPPTESDTDCNDYIKLHNASSEPIDLQDYRVRTDSGGLKASSSNAFPLAGVLDPGAYTVVSLRANSELISITNTGGYVWLEDTYGIVTFEPIVSYPDASAASKKGLSWALADDGTWKWMTPAPDGANYWPPSGLGPNQEGKGGLADCGPGRERNPATNRCRMVASAASSLIPCREGQVRNPETNRCRSTTSAGSALTPCKPGQIRNPETNRCKSTASTASTLVPCKPGQERNPETNRCRKVQGAATSVGNIQDIDVGTKASMTGWYVAGGALLLVAGYGIYEWRQDIALRLRKPWKKK